MVNYVQKEVFKNKFKFLKFTLLFFIFFSVVKKEGANNGKVFYVCAKEQSEQCKFFKWESDLKDPKTPSKNNTPLNSQEITEVEVPNCTHDEPSVKRGDFFFFFLFFF